jgi:23S rRNA pseudouridine955/2504/2580 synthase
MREWTIQKNDAGQRLDKFLTKSLPQLSQSLLYKYLRLKRIKLGGKRVEANYRLQEGDVLQLYLNDSLFEETTPKIRMAKQPVSLDVVYEDENLLLINKPAGLVVHEDDNGSTDTLVNRMIQYLMQKGEYDPQKERSFVPALCNRIDRNTSGIVIAAKTAQALRVLNQKVKDREIDKRYLCVVAGHLPPQAELKAFMRKDEKKNEVRVFDHPVPNGKTMLTNYRVLKSGKEASLLEVELVTGRTHQIRAHFAHIGHPLIGDGKYGNRAINQKFGCKYQLLCAYQLTFRFTTDAESLNNLNGKTFSVEPSWLKNLSL